MNNWLIRRKANLARPGCIDSVVDVGLIYAGDKRAHKWVVECYNGNVVADLSGYTAHGIFVRPDKATVPVEGTISGNVVSIVLDKLCYAIPGQLKGIVRIENALTEEIVTIGAMAVRVAPSDTETVIDTGTAIPDLADLLAEIAALNSLNNTIAEAEAARATAEELRVAAEQSRVDAETARGTAEQNRMTAETNRVEAEQGRVDAEAARGTAEQNRMTAEGLRVAAEQGRVDAEAARGTAEQNRVTAEGLRVAAEQGRVDAEAARGTAEQNRVTAEGLRVAAEQGRVDAEVARGTAEQNRVTAEGLRVAAEQGRVDAEAARGTAEQNRVTAEGLRVAAEQSRLDAYNDKMELFDNIQVKVEPVEDGALITLTDPNGNTTSATVASSVDVPRFGVSGIGGSAAALTRLWDAVDLGTPTPGTNTTPGSSAFDAYAPFNRKKCVGSWALVDGKATFTVNAYYGDPDYTEDGSNGDYVCVDVEPFYYIDAGGILGVSTYQYPGWSLHPVCQDYDGNMLEHRYLPCYQVSMKNSRPVSLPGLYPDNGSYSQLMVKLRAYSADLANHVMLEPSAVNHYEWMLYTIEFATQNCQSIMYGAASLRHGEDMITAVAGTNQIVMAKSIAQNYVVGQTIGITNSIWDNPTPSTAYCQITALDLCDEDGTPNDAGSYYLVTYNGADRSAEITIGTHRCVSRPWICGATQGYAPGVPAIIGHTGSPISNTSGKYPCVYRYRENPFGNQNLTCMDLFDVRVDEGDEVYHLEWYYMYDPRLWMPYATTNPSQADLENPAKGFRKLTVETPSSSYVNGYIVAEASDPSAPHVRVPVLTTGGSSTTYMCDYAYLVNTTVVRAVRRGGSLNYGVNAGFRNATAYNAPSSGHWYFGGGLYFVQ